MSKRLRNYIVVDEVKLIDMTGMSHEGRPMVIMPEKQMLISMITRAIKDYSRKFAKEYDARFYVRGDYLEPDIWFFKTCNSKKEFTFGWVCEQLSDNPDSLKGVILDYLEKLRLDYEQRGKTGFEHPDFK